MIWNSNIYSSIVTPGNQQIRNRFPHLVNDDLTMGKTSPIFQVLPMQETVEYQRLKGEDL